MKFMSKINSKILKISSNIIKSINKQEKQKKSKYAPGVFFSDKNDIENDFSWGFLDTSFEAQKNNSVILTGNRYPLSGQELPNLLPWMSEKVGVKLNHNDKNEPKFSPVVKDRIENISFENDLKLLKIKASTNDMIRLRHGHGHTQDEIYSLKYGSFTRLPDIVLFPKTEDEVLKLVQLALKYNVVIIPYGGGTNVTQALKCPDNENRMIASVSMKNLSDIRWIDTENRLACIEAGAVGRNIMAQLKDHGFTIGHEPDSIEFSTMGGWIATNASGMKKNKYGNIEDIVIDVNVITLDGKLERKQICPRESIGIEPKLWLFGSEGQIGIITSAIVKIFPLPEVQEYDSILFKTFEEGIKFMKELGQSKIWPASVRLVDNTQFQFGMALKPANKGVKIIKSKLEKSFVTKFKGFDPDQMVACTIVYEGTHEETRFQKNIVDSISKKYNGMKAGKENGERGYQLTFGIAYIRDFAMQHWLLAESFETSVQWSELENLVKNVNQRINEEHKKRNLPGVPFISARISQIYEAGATVYFYFAFYYKDIENPTHVYHEIENAAREEILKCGGSLSHHHGIGKIRKNFLSNIASETSLKWKDKLKESLDPQNIFGCNNQ